MNKKINLSNKLTWIFYFPFDKVKKATNSPRTFVHYYIILVKAGFRDESDAGIHLVVVDSSLDGHPHRT